MSPRRMIRRRCCWTLGSGTGTADGTRQVRDALAPLRPRPNAADVGRFAGDRADRHPRIQARVRVLEDHLEPLPKAPQLLSPEKLLLAIRRVAQLDAVELDRA